MTDRARRKKTSGPASDLAIGWLRVSTKEQADSNHSLPNQRQRIIAFASRDDVATRKFGRGWRIEKWFEGRGESAFQGRREQWNEMLAHVRRHPGRYGAILVDDLSRFARNVADQAAAFTELRGLGVEIRSVLQPSIDNTPLGRFIGIIQGAIDQLSSDEKSAKSAGAILDSYEAGRWPHQSPTGFRPSGTPGVPEVDGLQGELMRQLFESVADGEHVAAAWRAARRRGLHLSRVRAHELLKSPFYVARIELPDGRLVPGQWQPLVTEEVWRRVQVRVGGRAQLAVRKYQREDPEVPLKGHLVCGGCGRRLTVDRSTRGKRPSLRTYVECPARRPARTVGCPRCTPAELDVVFRDLLRRTVLLDGLSPTLIREGWDETMNRHRQERASVLRELAAKRAEQAGAVARLVTTSSPTVAAALEGRVEQLADEIKEAQARLDEITADLKNADIDIEALAAYVERAMGDLESEWRSRTYKEKKAILRFAYPAGLSVVAEDAGIRIRTPVTASVLTVLPPNRDGVEGLASPTGFEPVFWP